MHTLFVLCVCFVAYASANELKEYEDALKALDWNAVKEDIKAMLTNSQSFWPADYGNYGPFMIRQAWHCSGSYRSYDGRGGCDGGRQRFDPERSWDDNTNLDKAKTLLWPIKEKYGLGLSWGDLIILTGTTAIESMGGPVLGFCGGRIDDLSGEESELLGPTPIQNATYPCPVNGECDVPLGSTTIGLIYVNPEGPMGNPIPEKSAGEVRDTFSRMNMDDKETVALIGGGHAFGKTHGACPLGPGPSPKEDPSNPWPGKCGSGKGKDTFTSGFEGPWTTKPTTWSNLYFQELAKNTWSVEVGPGGHHQWKTASVPGIMMLTTDISLTRDPTGSYQKYVKLFAQDLAELEDTFSHAWYKLVSRDIGPVTRCAGPWVPPPQPFQYPLPAAPASLPDWSAVRSEIKAVLYSNSSSILVPDVVLGGRPYYGAVFVHLAYQCASTFRHTDYQGGCNGARIRYSPGKDFPMNAYLDKALALLAPIKKEFDNLSWADLIVLAGTVAIEDATGTQLPFCGGRTDAADGEGWESIQPNGSLELNFDQIRRHAHLMKLSDKEIVALSARLRSPEQMSRLGYLQGSFTQSINSLDNEYFKNLLSQTWQPVSLPKSGVTEFRSASGLYMTLYDLNLKWDATFLAYAQEFAGDNTLFVDEFTKAWTKLMNSDRFDGPTGNLCHKQ
eukprot:TRINITY_DN11363_c0_g1_i1.p1 TRINITY_DN11363_c0_g1~~TRINITY_DN11363_c0_g1_i1.p1  ORF type:complete len:685 (-),score=163.62 TRINITY_DN11363_c0_g1_i1:27-2042(-)